MLVSKKYPELGVAGVGAVNWSEIMDSLSKAYAASLTAKAARRQAEADLARMRSERIAAQELMDRQAGPRLTAGFGAGMSPMLMLAVGGLLAFMLIGRRPARGRRR